MCKLCKTHRVRDKHRKQTRCWAAQLPRHILKLARKREEEEGRREEGEEGEEEGGGRREERGGGRRQEAGRKRDEQ